MADDLKGLETWNDAMTSLQLLQIDPYSFGGIWVRAPFGPVRECWLQHLSQTSLNTVKLPGHIDVERLLGGIDLSATLQSGKLHMQSGLLQQADQGLVCISMAENFPSALVAWRKLSPDSSMASCCRRLCAKSFRVGSPSSI